MWHLVSDLCIKINTLFFSLSGGSDKTHRGVIPNKAKAEEFATRQFNAAKKEQNAADQKNSSSIFRRRRDKAGRQRRSKSLGKVSLFSFLGCASYAGRCSLWIIFNCFMFINFFVVFVIKQIRKARCKSFTSYTKLHQSISLDSERFFSLVSLVKENFWPHCTPKQSKE